MKVKKKYGIRYKKSILAHFWLSVYVLGSPWPEAAIYKRGNKIKEFKLVEIKSKYKESMSK